MGKWKCNTCDYVYNPEKGDISADIPKGTAFEELPEDWVCPKCGASREQFQRL